MGLLEKLTKGKEKGWVRGEERRGFGFGEGEKRRERKKGESRVKQGETSIKGGKSGKFRAIQCSEIVWSVSGCLRFFHPLCRFDLI